MATYNSPNPLLEEIIQILTIAGNYNGKVFDTFVIQTLNPPIPYSTPSKVHIWFSKQKDAHKFRDEVPSLIHIASDVADKIPHVKSIAQYRLKDSVKFYIVISKFFPVIDLDINCVTLQYSSDRPPVWELAGPYFGLHPSVRKQHLTTILQQITDKIGFILPSLIAEISHLDIYYAKKIIRNYLSMGWKIKYRSDYFKGHADTQTLARWLSSLKPSRILLVPNLKNRFLPVMKYQHTPEEDRKVALEHIVECLKVAAEYQGEVFGGFVRGILALDSSSCNRYYKDVDVWFQTELQADQFIQKMGKRFVPFMSPTSGDDLIYPFNRRRYLLVVDGIIVTWFDIILSSTFPVDDFDVNCLTATYDSSGEIIWKSRVTHFGSTLSVEELISAIQERRARILNSMLKLFADSKRKDRQHFMLLRIKKRYLELDWTIQYRDYQYDPSTDFTSWLKISTIRALQEEVEVRPENFKLKSIMAGLRPIGYDTFRS